MEKQRYYNRIENISNHGVSQGIVTRFILQMHDMEKHAFLDENERVSRMGKYVEVVITDFTQFYDLYKEINEIFQTYQSEVLSGDLVVKDKDGLLKIDRSIEARFNTKVTDFFIRGRILLNNWAKSKVLDDKYFCLKDLLIVSPSNFQKNRIDLLKKDDLSRYKCLFDFVENARNNFLTNFNKTRDEIEHNVFKIPRFTIDSIDGKIVFEQPKLDGFNLMDLLNYYYDSLFDFIETMMVFYLGINSFFNYEGLMTLCMRKEFDYKELKCKYVIATGNNDPNLVKLIEEN